jgi:hypothetical protein
MPAAWYRLTAAPDCRPRRLPLHPVRVPDRVKCLDLRCALPQAVVLRTLRPGARRPEAQSLRFLEAGDKLILKYGLAASRAGFSCLMVMSVAADHLGGLCTCC